jgi:hypothetical protein
LLAFAARNARGIGLVNWHPDRSPSLRFSGVWAPAGDGEELLSRQVQSFTVARDARLAPNLDRAGSPTTAAWAAETGPRTSKTGLTLFRYVRRPRCLRGARRGGAAMIDCLLYAYSVKGLSQSLAKPFIELVEPTGIEPVTSTMTLLRMTMRGISIRYAGPLKSPRNLPA